MFLPFLKSFLHNIDMNKTILKRIWSDKVRKDFKQIIKKGHHNTSNSTIFVENAIFVCTIMC